MRETFRLIQNSSGLNTRGTRLLAHLVAALIWSLAPSLVLANPSDLGNLVGYECRSEGVKIKADQGTLLVTPLIGGAIRVQLCNKETCPPTNEPYSLQKGALNPAPFSLKEEPGALWLSFEGHGVSIETSPVRLAFLGKTGDTLARELKPLRFEPAQTGLSAWLTMALPDNTHIYGLGEKTGPLDRVGQSYTLWNIDNFAYAPDSDPLYLSCPFFVALKGQEAYGMFFENPSKMHFDFGASDPGQVVVSQDGGNLIYYVLFGPSIPEVVRRYALLTGTSPMPPIWALGHAYSFRYSDRPAEDIPRAALAAKQAGFPLDTLWMDTWSMEGFKSFTIGIPNFPELVQKLKGMGVHLVNIVDPLIEADEEYRVFSEGMAIDAFVKRKDGSLYTGMSPVAQLEGLDKAYVLPDFTRQDVRAWWGGLFQGQLDLGIEGFWHDLNEPTVVNSLEEWLVNYPKTPTEDVVFGGEDGRNGLLHSQVHNTYGLLMARASYEGLKRLQAPKRPFLVSRSGFSGIQRYAWVWTGDNVASFSHLALAHRMFLGMGLSGIPFAGADIGGFVPEEWPELTVRWYQASALTPLFRKHKSNPLGYDHGPWTLSEPYLSAAREAILLRYELLPYLYTCVYLSSKKGDPVLRPLVYAYQDDETTYQLDDAFLVGENMLVAPVLKAGTKERRVYLPRGLWYDKANKAPLKGPAWLDVPAPLNRLPVFIKAGSVIPRARLDPPVAASSPKGTLLLDVYPQDDGKARESFVYLDDGLSVGSPSALFRFLLQRQEQGLVLGVGKEGDYRGVDTFEVRVYGIMPARVLKDGNPLPFRLEEGSAVFSIGAEPCKVEVLNGP